MQIAFIACSKTKKRTPDRARYLYQGELFRKALRYTEPKFDMVLILSALYGVVRLDEIIEPYEKTLNNSSSQERLLWAKRVKKQLRAMNLKHEDYWFFTGSKYHEHFEGQKPLLGLSLGKQLQWFNVRLKQREEELL